MPTRHAPSSCLDPAAIQSPAPSRPRVERPLTPREEEILALSAAGLSCKEIGRRLDISPRTVDAHRYRILRKIGMRSIAEVRRQVAAEREQEEDDARAVLPA